MSIPRYPKYKDSGVEWLGEAPEHWEVKKMKHRARSIEQDRSPHCERVTTESDFEWSVLKVAGTLRVPSAEALAPLRAPSAGAHGTRSVASAGAHGTRSVPTTLCHAMPAFSLRKKEGLIWPGRMGFHGIEWETWNRSLVIGCGPSDVIPEESSKGRYNIHPCKARFGDEAGFEVLPGIANFRCPHRVVCRRRGPCC